MKLIKQGVALKDKITQYIFGCHKCGAEWRYDEEDVSNWNPTERYPFWDYYATYCPGCGSYGKVCVGGGGAVSAEGFTKRKVE